ncbi:MAG: hypothetical protein JWQ35_2639 [Bacteriovoracaceae bacterium]|nr:hypothetical protein [Bacteriovoracaceae bacterium]
MRIYLVLSIASFLGVFANASVLSQSLADSEVIESALSQAKTMLTDPESREKEVNKTSAGRAANAQLKSLGGSDETNKEIYNLASEVFGNLVKETNGDPAKMKRILADAQKDPSSFAEKYFSKSDKSKLKKTAQQIPLN